MPLRCPPMCKPVARGQSYHKQYPMPHFDFSAYHPGKNSSARIDHNYVILIT
ncbi:hypothetical protein OIU79_028343 [Salix purpurea]|uniref:Uncharacterized protein n=1 Tax=Salix purpurea TaxID=77065 RepID=A0A9Q0VWL2_SALPP|nr:hypothetical protein OIU79_028343 [Salix purpurea]